MDVFQGRFDGAMAQQQLQGVGIDASIEEMRGEGVAKGVEPRALCDAGARSRLIVDLLSRAAGHGLVGSGAGEEPGPWTGDLPIGAQFEQ